ncbi:substrate-binding domain-containing protein [Actinomycetospora sp. NBC_00405]|uniref:substrate-binding domain-containing protein n=1 Tax=Actinomycetospora sp. NBC_00405 TaxID=2975952 RepID=UPI002E219060
MHESVRVALVVPLQGSAGMYGPSCELCADLAVMQLNAADGLLGREVSLRVVDGGRDPGAVADEVDRLLRADHIDAVVGWHISAVRDVVAPRIASRVPYVFTALYEGGLHQPEVLFTGETPDAQVVPALHWMAREFGTRRWSVVGNDYAWPRRSVVATRAGARAAGIDILDEVFVPLGTTDFGPALRQIERADSEGVLMFLVGTDAVEFNRQFAEAGLETRWQRLTPLMDENMLMASGASATRDLYTAAGYFEALPTADNLRFSADFVSSFGVEAPVLNSVGESCYEGMQLLSTLVERAQSIALPEVMAAAERLTYCGPRGRIDVRNGRVHQNVYIAAPSDLEYDVLASL